jgi:hypothetical protein
MHGNRTVIPARDPGSSSWIPAFAGMTVAALESVMSIGYYMAYGSANIEASAGITIRYGEIFRILFRGVK